MASPYLRKNIMRLWGTDHVSTGVGELLVLRLAFRLGSGVPTFILQGFSRAILWGLSGMPTHDL